MKKKICFFTGTRAEYGLLKPLMSLVKADAKDFEFRLLVSGAHLSPEFGMTAREIEADGFQPDEKVEMLLGSDTPEAISKSMGLGMMGFAEALERIAPDALVLLGDRYEAFAAAAAATIMRIPIIHLHGGELTYGVVDEPFRHSITKMSSFHFTSTEEHRKRVIQLGECPDRVFNTGAPGIDNIVSLKLPTKKELEKELGFRFGERTIVVAFHPTTMEKASAGKQTDILLEAIDGQKNLKAIFTAANADTYGRIINEKMAKYTEKSPAKAVMFKSLGQRRFLAAMKHSDGIVGNSSSGIIEAPSLKIGTINIGDRQKGRARAASVIDCEPEKKSLDAAFKKLFSENFRKSLAAVKNPYGDGGASKKMLELMKKMDFKGCLKKKFHDIKFKA